jgi:D-alanine-D-alanine ligase
VTDRLRRLLILLEPEVACQQRMLARGYPAEVAGDIAFYLAQATDFLPVVEPLRLRLAVEGVELRVAALDDRDDWLPLLAGPDAAGTLVWCLTDGFAWYRGSFVSSLAALLDLTQLGSPPAAQHLCQDKLRCLALARSIGLATPPTVLVEDGELLSPVEALTGAAQLFVKPNTLGAKLGIDGGSRVMTLAEALAASRRIWRRYGDRALIQPYLPGRDVRVSFMDLGGEPSPLGIYAVRASERGFPTLEDSRRITAMRAADGRLLTVESLAGTSAGQRIEAVARHLARVAGLCHYWSMDFRLDEDGTPWFLELEVCPAVTIYDFLTYLRQAHGVSPPEAITLAASAAWKRRSLPPFGQSA